MYIYVYIGLTLTWKLASDHRNFGSQKASLGSPFRRPCRANTNMVHAQKPSGLNLPAPPPTYLATGLPQGRLSVVFSPEKEFPVNPLSARVHPFWLSDASSYSHELNRWPTHLPTYLRSTPRFYFLLFRVNPLTSLPTCQTIHAPTYLPTYPPTYLATGLPQGRLSVVSSPGLTQAVCNMPLVLFPECTSWAQSGTLCFESQNRLPVVFAPEKEGPVAVCNMPLVLSLPTHTILFSSRYPYYIFTPHKLSTGFFFFFQGRLSVVFSPEKEGPLSHPLVLVCDNCEVKELSVGGTGCVASVQIETVDGRPPLFEHNGRALQVRLFSRIDGCMDIYGYLYLYIHVHIYIYGYK